MKYSRVILMDAPISMGSPQVLALAETLTRSFGGKTLVIEPHTPGSPLTKNPTGINEIEILRIPTRQNPHNGISGATEYLNQVSGFLKEIELDEMFLCSPFVIPILSILKKGIKKITYYMLETPDMYGEWVKNSHHNLENQVDRIIYIEKNRYVRDSQDFNLKKIPATLYYNSYPVSEKPLSILERNKRSLNYGTLTSRHTYLSWYQEPQIQKFPIDLIGQISEPFTPSDQIRKFDRVPHDLISAVVRNYSYVITVWNEHERRSRFAPSNKFFEAVSLGVPVISAPHPQHVEVIRELGCGIVMNDWKLESFEQALEEAQKLIAGDKYAELVEGCFRFAHSRYGPKANSQKLIEFLEATS